MISAALEWSMKTLKQMSIVIINNTLSAFAKPTKAYHRVTGHFGILQQLKSIAQKEILQKNSKYCQCLPRGFGRKPRQTRAVR